MSRAEYEEDLHAELGYRTAGRRELSQREWFSLRGDANEVAPNPKAFAKLVAGLRVKKWVRANPEKRKAIANRYAHKPGIIPAMIEKARQRRAKAFKAEATAIVCKECGAEFCPVSARWRSGNRKREFCTINCTARFWQRTKRRKAGARVTACRKCREPGHNSRTCPS